MNTTSVVEALQSFGVWAKRIEDTSDGARDPQLVIYGDGSGEIVDRADGQVYLEAFGSFTDLLQWLKG